MNRRSHLRAEHGYSMIVVMLVMLVTSIIGGAAFAAVGGDIPFARASQDRKQAYGAAEAGIQYYLYQLSRDNDYWTNCADVPDPAPGQASPVTLPGEPRSWRALPGGESEYSIELLPSGEQPCDPDDPQSTMLDQSTGTFRIRSTGRSRGIYRSVIATFRRSSFLDYLYFTDFETFDPQLYSNQTDRTWADANCVRPRAQRHEDCREITFPTFDAIRGPLHTNDDILTCGNPKFGRNPAEPGREGKPLDRIEISGPAPNGWTPNGCSGTPTFWGTKVHPAATLTVPPSNNSLAAVAASGGTPLTGKVAIRFDGSQYMYVKQGDSATETAKPLPSNGVIYVASGSCPSGIRSPLEQNYSDGVGCAVASVKGTYPKSMTIASQADILVTGDLIGTNDAVLGLIANNFVRVRHPVTRSGNNCANAADVMQNVRIEAAMLSLAHSFIVDNYNCGNRLGTLSIKGALAQKFRGTVGTFNTSSGQSVTGYTKDYEYDDRLKYRSPPYFLDPVSAAWRVIRANEQVPATRD